MSDLSLGTLDGVLSNCIVMAPGMMKQWSTP